MLSPSELVAKARQRGLSALALTDHDSVEGLEEAHAAGAREGIEVINGVELSVSVGEDEVHVLGYFFDRHHAGLLGYLEYFRKERYVRAGRIIERLNALGVPLTFEAVEAEAGQSAFGRPHIARALVAGGFVAAYPDAFEHYLGWNGPANVAKTLFPATEALRVLHEAGGLAVLAHPGHWTSDATLMTLIRAGLDGIETIHPSHDALLIHYYKQIVRDFFLIETGGSDYHGGRPEDEENFGAVTIPYAQLERIRSAV